MKLSSFFAVAAVVAGSSAQFQVNTPGSVVQCIPTQITFSGGTAPYTLLIQTPDANGVIEQEIDSIQSSPITWATNITATIQLGLTLRDSSGASAQSGTFIVNTGSDSSCLTDSGAVTSDTSAATSAASSAASSGSDSVSATDSTTSAVSDVSSTPASSVSATSTSPVSTATSHSSVSGSSVSGGSSSTHASSTGSSASTSASAAASSGAAMVNAASSGVVGLIGFLLAGFMA